jgi:hypothetical protein
MGWVKLDDGFPTHPKVVGLTLEARWAYIESLCYAAKYETDGLIPGIVAPNGPVREELLAAGLWERGRASSVQVHDFLFYNPSRTEKERKRNRSRTDRASREGAGSGTGAVGGGGLGEGDAAFAEFWAIYPRKVGKPRARTAFVAAIRRASIEDVLTGAKRLAEDPNLPEAQFVPHPTTWLHRDGWEDEPLPSRVEHRAHPPDPPRPMTSGEMDVYIKEAVWRDE